MKLVIEREGGFTVVEDADAITEIDVTSGAVVLTIEVGGDKWTKKLLVTDHAEACRVSAAIAVRCGTLVEPLAEAPDLDDAMSAASAALVRERSRPWKAAGVSDELPSNGIEDAEDDDLRGAAMAGRIRKPVSEWVEGEPPRDGRFWVAAVAAGVAPGLSRWDGKRWHDGDGATYECALLAHLPTPIPPFSGAGAEGGK